METLRQVVKEMGFRYIQKNGSTYLRQTSAVALKRVGFLTQYLSLKQQGTHDFVFLDETWVYRKGTGMGKAWQDGTAESNPHKFASYGDRYVVIGAGGRNGFIPGSLKVFSARKKVHPGDDYHGDLNGKIFLKWFKEMFLPNLRKKSVILLDNAAYHRVQVEDSKNPTKGWKKEEIVKWLRHQGVQEDAVLGKTKDELLKMVRPLKKTMRLKIEEAIEGTMHILLWLPPYHADLYNPIEMIWSQAKGFYEKTICTYSAFTEAATIDCLNRAQKEINAKKWNNCCEHTEKVVLKHAAECLGALRAGLHRPIVIDANLSDDDSDCDPLSVEDFVDASPIKPPPKPEWESLLEQLPEVLETQDACESSQSRKRRKGRKETRRNLLPDFISADDDVTVVLKRGSYGWKSPVSVPLKEKNFNERPGCDVVGNKASSNVAENLQSNASTYGDTGSAVENDLSCYSKIADTAGQKQHESFSCILEADEYSYSEVVDDPDFRPLPTDIIDDSSPTEIATFKECDDPLIPLSPLVRTMKKHAWKVKHEERSSYCEPGRSPKDVLHSEDEIEVVSYQPPDPSKKRRIVQANIRPGPYRYNPQPDLCRIRCDQCVFLGVSRTDKRSITTHMSAADNDCVVKKMGVKLCGRDIRTLRPGGWLNDEVINYYFKMAEDRSKKSTIAAVPTLYAFNCFFYPDLSNFVYEVVREKWGVVNIFEYDILLFPIYEHSHWSLTVVDTRSFAIVYYDSFHPEKNHCLDLIESYLNVECTNIGARQVDWIKHTAEVPKQGNGYDCGVFMCLFAEHASQRIFPTFTQAIVDGMRQNILMDILTGNLVYSACCSIFAEASTTRLVT